MDNYRQSIRQTPTKQKENKRGGIPLSKQAHSWQTSQDCTLKLDRLEDDNIMKSSCISDVSESEETQEIEIGSETRETENLSYQEYESHYDEIWSNLFNNNNGVFYNLDEIGTINDKFYKDASQLYEFYEIVGEGSFSQVYRALFHPTGEIIAVKISKAAYENEKGNELVHQEAKLLSQLYHPNIVKVKHLIQVNGKLYMGMELVKCGSLAQLIKTNGKMSDIDSSKIMNSILSAVSYIHDKNVIHRDLKLANILIQDSTNLKSVKIIDFGFGHQKHSSANYDEHVGTLVYMAPEVAFEYEYTKSVDVWATGIIMHYVITGKHPFYDKESDGTASFKKKLKDLKKVEPVEKISWVAKNLFQRLTTISAHMRYTSKDAQAHPWITRNKYDKIPDSFIDKMSKFEQESILKQKIQAFVFLSMIKQQQEGINFESNIFKSYKRKINKVSIKIKKWHEEITLGHNEFKNDSDFIPDIESPSRFSDYDSLEEEEEEEEENSQTITYVSKSNKSTINKQQKMSSSVKITNPNKRSSAGSNQSIVTSTKGLKKPNLAGKLQSMRTSNYKQTDQAVLSALGASGEDHNRKSQFKNNKHASDQFPDRAVSNPSLTQFPQTRVKAKLQRNSFSMNQGAAEQGVVKTKGDSNIQRD